jgi:hypothetical protein
MTTLRRLVAVMVLAVPLSTAGCRTAPCAGDVPPIPPTPSTASQSGGGLLQTGAIQLGPGLGQNWWRWQGDGQWGFQ